MAILASVATVADLGSNSRVLEEWVDACVLAHVEQGIPYDRAARFCRSHVESPSRA